MHVHHLPVHGALVKELTASLRRSYRMGCRHPDWASSSGIISKIMNLVRRAFSGRDSHLSQGVFPER
jgi:hypothetical protein